MREMPQAQPPGSQDSRALVLSELRESGSVDRERLFRVMQRFD
jgi:hypothetical protein